MTNNERKITTNFHGRTQEEWQKLKKNYHKLSRTDTRIMTKIKEKLTSDFHGRTQNNYKK